MLVIPSCHISYDIITSNCIFSALKDLYLLLHVCCCLFFFQSLSGIRHTEYVFVLFVIFPHVRVKYINAVCTSYIADYYCNYCFLK